MTTKPLITTKPRGYSVHRKTLLKTFLKHRIGRERRRITLDEGLPYSHGHTEWLSNATWLERSQLAGLAVVEAPHHGRAAAEDLVDLIARCATHVASKSAFTEMMRSVADRLSLSPLVRREAEVPRMAAAEERLSRLEQRMARLELLSTPRFATPEAGDPFDAFHELREKLGEERFRWIVDDD